MDGSRTFLGVDIGSVSVSAVLVDAQGRVRGTQYRPHEGRLEETARQVVGLFDAGQLEGLALTSDSPAVLGQAAVYDPVVCLMRGVRHLKPLTRSILNIGGQKFSLILFDQAGDYRKVRGNSPCAAGTGSFLDQQARRLTLASTAELAGLAARNRGPVPAIASRCSVFAKTDLIHAQQQGCSLEAVCDGLCLGLARAVVDTLFSGEKVLEPVVLTGGLAANEAVRHHLSKLTGLAIGREKLSPLFGALGAALSLRDQALSGRPVIRPRAALDASADDPPAEKIYAYPPLEPKTAGYPDFRSNERSLYVSRRGGPSNPVEVDIYADLGGRGGAPVVLGLDIGSTSTKAVLMDEARRILAGFYTRTAGDPVKAVQSVFEAIQTAAARAGAALPVNAAATTGSGRKFLGALIRADLVIDEITAHASAAVELDPEVDTIIEIGGQDAKFTVLRKGRVTFSRMNTVCAAGTGSFLEEQAAKLGVSLADYAALARGARAPLTSDRCTVFMERDINHYLARNYSISEMLAAALYAVCENYFHKVAEGSRPGQRVCFQGATAKNPALVAVFESKIGRPIRVSPWCHLTGAYGAALEALRARAGDSGFRGFGLADQDIPLRHESCNLCRNNCRLTVALVSGETVSFGRQCGRDDDAGGRERGRSGFRLVGNWNEPFAFARAKPRRKTTIGLPAALYLVDELPLWKKFFDELGLPVLTSEGLKGAVAEGKRLSRAEFCAPMAEFQGHVAHLAGKADLIFAPHYLDEHAGGRKSWCYYTQFAACLAGQFVPPGARLACPLVRSETLKPNAVVEEIQTALAAAGLDGLDSREIGRAWRQASVWFAAARGRLHELFRENHRGDGDVEVVLFGRPYILLSPALNKNIPDIFDRLGVRCFSSDMLPPGRPAGPRLPYSQLPWKFAAEMLEAAEAVAGMQGVYPVMVSAFKCTPDSYLLDAFQRVFETCDKPYLILQIDEHDSNAGYETRIEAGIRAFRNHLRNARMPSPAVRSGATVLSSLDKRRSLFMPNWDPLTVPLLAAGLRREGFDARILAGDSHSIMAGMRHNSGQCIPASILAEDFLRALAGGSADPEKSVLWLPYTTWACNIPMLPAYIKTIVERHGFSAAGVYAGDLTFMTISAFMAVNAWYAYLFGGVLRRLVCRLRPYENVTGASASALAEALPLLERSMLAGEDFEKTANKLAAIFSGVAVSRERKPLVAVFGDLYVRDNDMMNQDLIRCIEDAGGEAHVTPYSDYVKIIAASYFQRMLKEQSILNFLRLRAILPWLEHLEQRCMRPLVALLGEPFSHNQTTAFRRAGELGLRLEHEGESFDNALKIFHIVERQPGLRLLVQANPAFCCPSLVTEAMGGAIERLTGVPLLTITYDGTGAPKNQLIAPYLAFNT